MRPVSVFLIFNCQTPVENIHLKKSDFVHIETDLDLYKQRNIYYDKRELCLI